MPCEITFGETILMSQFYGQEQLIMIMKHKKCRRDVIIRGSMKSPDNGRQVCNVRCLQSLKGHTCHPPMVSNCLTSLSSMKCCIYINQHIFPIPGKNGKRSGQKDIKLTVAFSCDFLTLAGNPSHQGSR